MLKKLRLSQGDNYQRAVATNELAKMLIKFVKGREHYLSIGTEQGELTKWDDIVIEKTINSYIHIQVKRQTTAFGDNNDECERNNITHRDGTIEKKKLSSLDETLKDLADWSTNIDVTNLIIKREFLIELPELGTQIKKGLHVRILKDLCENHINSATTKAQDLEALGKEDNNINNCLLWLKSWCDFQSLDHILKALQFLKVRTVGTDNDINKNTEERLEDVFVNAKCKEVRCKINSYTIENNSFASGISPRNLLLELKDYLHQDIATWTQFEKVNSQWNITGIHDLEFNTEIERPLSVVPKLWSNKSKRSLIINAPVNDDCKLSESLIRLAIHNDGLTSTLITNKTEWERTSKIKVGGTLGIGADDFDKLTFIENNEQFTSSNYKTLTTIPEQEKIADELNESMFITTWLSVKRGINDKLLSMNTDKSAELRDAVDLRWKDWKQKLDNFPTEQKELLTNMLHPNAEGDDIIGYIRVGTKTVTLLIDGLFLVLIISVCLDEIGNGNWKKISDELSLNTISLQYWSGLPGKKRKVKKITEDCPKLIGKEKADLLIMSNIESSPSEILELTLIKSQENENTLANGKQLKLLITHNIRLRLLIGEGEVQPLKTYLESLIEKNEELKQEAINTVIS